MKRWTVLRLALSQNQMRLFQGKRYSVSVELSDVPQSIAEALK